MSRFCFFVQHCIWQVVCIRWDSIQSGEKEKNGNWVVKFQYFCHSPTSQVFPSSSQMCAKQCSSSNVTRISIWRPRCQTDNKKAWSSKPPPIPNLWEHQAQATNTKSIAWTSTSIDQLVGYALGSKKEIYPRDGEKGNHHHHQMLPSSRKNCQLSYRLCEFLLNSVKRWCLCLDWVVWSQHSLLWQGLYIKDLKW